MTCIEIKWLIACASFAAGAGLASLAPGGAEAWPLPLAVSVLAMLFGYGLSLRGWMVAVMLLVGVASFWLASVESEREYLAAPWMRGVRRRTAEHSACLHVRRRLSSRVGIGLSHNPDAAALNRAILLGERSRLSRSSRRIFVESGTIHVFAISGLHVMVIAKVLMFLAALLFVPHRFQGLVSMPVVWGYVCVIGAPPSAVRAAVMATLYFLAPLFWRRPNGLMAWSITFLAVHLVNPRQITDVGSQLSFAVMLSLVAAGRFARRSNGLAAKGIFPTVAAWAAGVPIAAMAFGSFTPGGLVANVILIAAAGYTVASGVIGLLASFVSTTAATHLNNLAALVVDGMVVAATLVARLPFSSFRVEGWGFAECVEWYMALVLAFVLVRMVRSRRDLV